MSEEELPDKEMAICPNCNNPEPVKEKELPYEEDGVRKFKRECPECGSKWIEIWELIATKPVEEEVDS